MSGRPNISRKDAQRAVNQLTEVAAKHFQSTEDAGFLLSLIIRSNPPKALLLELQRTLKTKALRDHVTTLLEGLG